MTAICGICQHKSWQGCGSHVASVMNNTPKSSWCTCEHVDENDNSNFPPRAGTGFARKSP